MRQAGKCLALVESAFAGLVATRARPQPPTGEALARFQRVYSSAMASTSSTAPNTSTASRAPTPCWQCGQDTGRAALVCDACGRVQPPSDNPADAYAMLVESIAPDEPKKFDIDLRQLERSYKSLQKVLHPDKFSSASQAEKEYSAEQAIRVNMAYAALKEPLSRADCLLRLAGAEDEEGTTIGALPHHSEMLMTFMEWREEIEEASDEETLVGLRDRIGDKIDECLEALRDAFDVRGDIERAKAEVQVLRYLKRMQERIIEKL